MRPRGLTIPADDEARLVPLLSSDDCRGIPWSGASPASRSSRSNPTIWLDLKSSRTSSTISGRIDPPGERDVFGIALKKGEKRIFSLESRALGLPLDAVLQVLDAAGKTLAETDDVGKALDPELAFTAPADGKYRVVVRDLNGRGGPHYAYLLRALAPEPDFTLTLSADKFDVTAGKPANVVVNIVRNQWIFRHDRRHGRRSSRLRGGDDGQINSLRCLRKVGDARDPRDGCSHSGPFRIIGRSADEKSLSRHAFAPIPGFETSTDHPWLTVVSPVKPKKP